jgi:hypothetical protein
MVFSIVDIIVSVLRVPVRVTHLIFFNEILLRFPDVAVSVGVFDRWEGSLIFRDVHLVLSHNVMQSGVHFILEPSVGHSQIVIWVNSDGQLTWNRIPRVLVHLPNWGITKRHHCHFVISSCRPKNFYLFSLRVGNNLSANISLVSLIEDINTKVDNQVSKIKASLLVKPGTLLKISSISVL